MKSYLELQDVQKLEEQASCLRDKLLIRLLFRLGCRVSEALNIRTEDIDLDAGTITIQHLKHRLEVSCPKCSSRLARRYTFCPNCGLKLLASERLLAALRRHRMRRLPVDGETLALLKEFLERMGKAGKTDDGFVFGINRHRA